MGEDEKRAEWKAIMKLLKEMERCGDIKLLNKKGGWKRIALIICQSH